MGFPDGSNEGEAKRRRGEGAQWTSEPPQRSLRVGGEVKLDLAV